MYGPVRAGIHDMLEAMRPLPLQEAQVRVRAAEGWYTRHAGQQNVSIHDIIDNWAGIHDITDN